MSAGLLDLVAKGGEAAKSGPIGLAVILLLCIGCYFLFKSMSKHLRTVREDFPAEQDKTTAPEPAPTAAADEVAAVPVESDHRPAAPPSAEPPSA